MSFTHRIPIPQGSHLSVAVGDEVRPDQELARRRTPLESQTVAVAGPLRRRPELAASLLLRPPGSFIDAGEPIAQASDGRQVLSPVAGLLLAYSRTDGNAIIAPLGPEEPILAHITGRVVTATTRPPTNNSQSYHLALAAGGAPAWSVVPLTREKIAS